MLGHTAEQDKEVSPCPAEFSLREMKKEHSQRWVSSKGRLLWWTLRGAMKSLERADCDPAGVFGWVGGSGRESWLSGLYLNRDTQDYRANMICWGDGRAGCWAQVISPGLEGAQSPKWVWLHVWAAQVRLGPSPQAGPVETLEDVFQQEKP